MKKKGSRALIIVLAVILIVGIGLFSFLFLNGLSGLHIRTDAQVGQIKVACVGDSITYGHGVTPWHKNNYPVVLQELLGDGYNVQNFGESGTTVQKDGDQPYWETKVYEESHEYNADILVFMLGSNDSKPENWKGEEAFKEQYIALLDTYITEGNSPEIYLGIPAKAFYEDENQTSGLTSYDIQGDIVEEIGKIVKEIAAERGYKYIDIYELTKDHPELFVSDLVHPNADGAKAIANEVYQRIYMTKHTSIDTDITKQIELIAKEIDLWYIEYTDVNYCGYCITDLNRNGLLELIACYNQGTGLYSENAIFEVNDDISGLNKYTMSDDYESQPDLIFFESANCYSKDGKYFYVFDDSIRYSNWENFTSINNVYFDGNKFNFEIIASETIKGIDENSYSTVNKNSNGDIITPIEFTNAEMIYYKDYESETVKLSWIKCQRNDEVKLINKTNTELIKWLTDSYNTFIGN